MKKLLALVLALVMTLSLAVVGSNAAFKDADKVNETYAEAVDVLAGMKVFQGYTDGSFQPEGSITRAEVAAIVYRLYTGDVADKQASLYATYNKFNDMDGAAWAKGYIGYCANAGLVKGYDAKTFAPQDKVTGYQALAMILRAVGYDKNGEFVGADWQLHVAQTAQQLGVLKNVKGEDLNAAASRQLVAELLFQTAANVPMVNYTAALGYTNLDSILNGKTNATLGYKNFGLTKVKDTDDKWGRPAYSWTNGKTGSAEVVYATIAEKPVKTYYTAVNECTVANDAGLKADTAYTLYVNGDKQLAKYVVNLTDTVTMMGAQGRLFEVYEDTIVMIDTYLAKVTYVSNATYDAQNHLRTPATITLEVYERNENTPYTLTNGKTNYEYAVGDYVLLNAFTATTGNTVTDSGMILTNNKKADILSKATSIDGAQSIIYWNAKQHNVEGKVYDDAAKFYLDQAKNDSAKYTWFFDQYNNLIGDVKIAAATSYGVINSIWWAGNATDGSGVAKANVTYMDGTTGQVDISKMTYNTAAISAAYAAKAGTVTHSTGIYNQVMTADKDNKYFYVDSYATTNANADKANGNGILNGHLFQFTTQANGTMAAYEVAGNGTNGLYNLETAVTKNTQVYGTNLGNMVVNDNTTYLVRSTSAAGYTFASVKGFTNIGNYVKGEVDFVDLNGDRIADYVYITAASATSKVTSLFFFDGKQASYTLADGTWVIEGYVDGEAGKVMVDGYNALPLTALKANTLYVVALEDGVVKNMREATNGQQLTAFSNEYPLAPAYDKYANTTLRINYVEGYAGTAPSYADRDTFNGSLYHDFDGTAYWGNSYVGGMYYSVIANTTKVVGTMGNPGEQNYYFVFVDNVNTANDLLCVQAYAFDKNAAKDAITVTTTNVAAVSGLGVANGRLDAVAFSAVGAGVKANGAVVSNIALTATAQWYVRNATENSFHAAGANEVFVPGSTYYAVITLGVPAAASATTSISPLNTITYTYGLGSTTTGVGTTVTTNFITI